MKNLLMPNIVYVLTNPSMPDIVKIGMTENLMGLGGIQGMGVADSVSAKKLSLMQPSRSFSGRYMVRKQMFFRFPANTWVGASHYSLATIWMGGVA